MRFLSPLAAGWLANIGGGKGMAESRRLFRTAMPAGGSGVSARHGAQKLAYVFLLI
jgi:hypothetical protein